MMPDWEAYESPELRAAMDHIQQQIEDREDAAFLGVDVAVIRRSREPPNTTAPDLCPQCGAYWSCGHTVRQQSLLLDLEQTLAEVRTLTQQRIAAAFGISPADLGLSDHSTMTFTSVTPKEDQ